MNATDTKTVIGFFEDDIQRMKDSIVKTKSECTHVWTDGTSAIVHGDMCAACQYEPSEPNPSNP